MFALLEGNSRYLAALACDVDNPGPEVIVLAEVALGRPWKFFGAGRGGYGTWRAVCGAGRGGCGAGRDELWAGTDFRGAGKGDAGFPGSSAPSFSTWKE